MKEQLSKLRELVETRKNNNCHVIAVTSGKGGVGKTVFAVNLSIALAKKGYKTVIVDADTNLANVDVLFGLRPKSTLADVILSQAKLEDVMIEDPNGIKIIPGNSGTKEFLYMDENIKERLLQEIWRLERSHDFIILDTASGVSPMAVDFAARANEVILITTPEPTAITDAYAMTKILHSFKENINLKLVLNLVSSKSEVNDIYERLSLVTDHFLGIKLDMIGYIQKDEAVQNSVLRQKPLLQIHPKSPASWCITQIAGKIIQYNMQRATRPLPVTQ